MAGLDVPRGEVFLFEMLQVEGQDELGLPLDGGGEYMAVFFVVGQSRDERLVAFGD